MRNEEFNDSELGAFFMDEGELSDDLIKSLLGMAKWQSIMDYMFEHGTAHSFHTTVKDTPEFKEFCEVALRDAVEGMK